MTEETMVNQNGASDTEPPVKKTRKPPMGMALEMEVVKKIAFQLARLGQNPIAYKRVVDYLNNYVVQKITEDPTDPFG